MGTEQVSTSTVLQWGPPHRGCHCPISGHRGCHRSQWVCGDIVTISADTTAQSVSWR